MDTSKTHEISAHNDNGYSAVDAALDYASQGMQVLPCKPDKSPRPLNGFYDATTDEKQIRSWWTKYPDSMVGIRTGAESGIFVADIDNGDEGHQSLRKLEAEHGPLPDTYTVTTAGSPNKGKGPGEHRYFRHPGGKVKSSASEIGINLDVRGDGGYIIAPPSPGYTATSGEFGKFAEAPGWLVNLVRGGRGRAEPLAEKLPGGQRNTSLTSMAGSMRLRGAPTSAILAALAETNRIMCDPPLEWREVVTIARSVGRYAPGSLAQTDLGNAERFAGRHGRDLLNVADVGWHIWTGTHWKRDKTGEVERRAKETARSIHEEAAHVDDDGRRKALAKWAVASESVNRLGAMIKLAGTEPGIPVTVDDLDADPWLLNVRNGTLDLRTGELREHLHKDHITKLAPVEYHPDAEAPVWEAFLAKALPNAEVRTFVQRLVGYSLTGVTTEKILPMLLGEGDTGKTTFIEAVMDMLGGDYAGPAAPELLLTSRGSNHPTEVADLLGRRFVPTVEVEEGRKLDESQVKQLTGGDTLKARHMRQDFFEFKPTHKVWFAANHAPVVRGSDDAIWNRIRKVVFGVVIPKNEQDKGLRWKFQTEAAGILAWAVRGCMDWQMHSLGEPEAVKLATDEYRGDMDTFAGFLDEWCETGPEKWAATRRLRKAYADWCHETGEKYPLDWKVVAERLRRLGCTRKRNRADGRGNPDSKGTPKEGWLGISVRLPGEAPFGISQ